MAPGTTLTYAAVDLGIRRAAATAEVFRANLAAIGLELDAAPIDFATYIGMLFGDMPADERPNLLPVVLVPGLQRRLEPPLAPGLL